MLGKCSFVTVEVSEPLKNSWCQRVSRCGTAHSTYQHMYDRTKAIIKQDATIAFYNEKEWLHVERDASCVSQSKFSAIERLNAVPRK